MRTAEMRSELAIANTIEMKLEVVVIPVSDAGDRVHASWLCMFSHLRQERDHGCARLDRA